MRINKKYPLFITLSFIASCSFLFLAFGKTNSGTKLKSDTTDSSEYNIEERMHFFKVPGLEIAYIKDFKIQEVKCYGVKDASGKDPVTESTLFQAASVSKPVTAMAALKLVQDGKISLDENINNKLTSWKVPENDFTEESKVTLKELLSHTAGTTVHGFGGYAKGEKIPTLTQVLNGQKPANSKPVIVDTIPGTKFSYSGGGTTIMQQALIDIEKTPFPEIMKKYVLVPLEMKQSSYEQPLPENQYTLAASGHDKNGKTIKGKWHTYPEIAAAGLWTTPSDLARYVIELQLSVQGKSNKVLSRETVEKMLTPVTSLDSFASIGLGPMLQNKKEAVYFSHGGSNEGFRCYFIAHKEKGYGAVIMTNADKGVPLIFEILNYTGKKRGWEGY